MAKILITGGSGLVGKRLSSLLAARGDQVIHLSRKADPTAEFPTFTWDIKQQQLDTSAFDGVDHIIHLAGAGIADERWSAARKKEILASRVQGTRLLVDALEWLPKKPKTFIAASAVGFYGDSDNLCTEDSVAGSDFLADTCVAWEKESSRAQTLTRTCIMRIGIVLSTEGGALPKLMLPFRLYAGAILGSGKQFMSWIHLDDLCAAFIHLIDHPETEGVYNGVAPIPETHYTFNKALAHVMRRPLWLWIPGIFLRLALGEMAITVLTGQQVSNEKLLQSGFHCKYGNIHSALTALIPQKD